MQKKFLKLRSDLQAKHSKAEASKRTNGMLNDLLILEEDYSKLSKELKEAKGEVAHLNFCINETTRDLTESINETDGIAKELFSLLSTLPNPVYFKNNKLQFVMVNHAFETWVNMTANEIYGKIEEQVYPQYMSRHIEKLEKEVLQKDEAILNLEEHIVIDDGETWFLTSISPYKNANGDIQGVIVSSLDITHQKKYELDLQKTNDIAQSAINIKNEFLANISHELRTPLHGIIGSAEILHQQNLNSESNSLVKIIEQSGKSLLKQVNDILFFSKRETERMKQESVVFNIHELMEELIAVNKPQILKKGIDIRCFKDEHIPSAITGDLEKIKQLLDIFISNSVKFTDKGFIHIVLRIESAKDHQIQLRFEVIDTGIGVRKSKQDDIFNLFSAGDSSLSKKHAGSGLGLSVAKKILDLLEGDYGFDSDEHKGSRFWFTLNFMLDHVEKDDEHKDMEPKDLPVLLVEDNIINQKIAFFTLKKIGFPVDIAENGEEAVEKFSKGNYKLILMDIQMPIMNGFDATEKIRAIELQKKNKKPVIIIALSANVLSNDIQHCYDVGMNEFISKPFSSAKLNEKITNYFNIK